MCNFRDREKVQKQQQYRYILALNALPSTLRDIADRTRFRKLLKTHFFNSLP